MKVFTPEISWHNRLPTLSLDISKPFDKDGQQFYRVATGGNDCRVYVWHIHIAPTSANGLTAQHAHHSNVNNKKHNPEASPPDIRIRAGLRRHQRSVGAVRFASNHTLASGDDDGYIYLWKLKDDSSDSNEKFGSDSFGMLNDDGFEDLETWQQLKGLRGHIEDICDLSWSHDSQYLLSGSVDNSAILWDAAKGTRLWSSDNIKGYVQGVAFDPATKYLAALSSDRTLRIFNFADKRLLNATRRMKLKGKFNAFFSDDTVQTFCRRFEFSPDGQYLLVPTSRIIEYTPAEIDLTLEDSDMDAQTENPTNCNESLPQQQQSNDLTPALADLSGTNHPNYVPKQNEQSDENQQGTPQQKQQPQYNQSKPYHALLVFKTSCFSKPVNYYPTGREVALCCRFCPLLYHLNDSDAYRVGGRLQNFWGLPYRLVFAIATSRSVILYDSQQPAPIGYISQIHCARLTDISWSSDGRLLMISSYDGYCTMIAFDEGEFGARYVGPMIDRVAIARHLELQAKLEAIQAQKEAELKLKQQQKPKPEQPKPAKPTSNLLKYFNYNQKV